MDAGSALRALMRESGALVVAEPKVEQRAHSGRISGCDPRPLELGLPAEPRLAVPPLPCSIALPHSPAGGESEQFTRRSAGEATMADLSLSDSDAFTGSRSGSPMSPWFRNVSSPLSTHVAPHVEGRPVAFDKDVLPPDTGHAEGAHSGQHLVHAAQSQTSALPSSREPAREASVSSWSESTVTATGPTNDSMAGPVPTAVVQGDGVPAYRRLRPADARQSDIVLARPQSAHVAKITPQPFAWLKELPPEARESLRQCKTPVEARQLLASILRVKLKEKQPRAPPGLAEDLRRHAQAMQRRAAYWEDALRQQAAEHDAELAALRSDHRKACRRAKLQILAQNSPQRLAALDAPLAQASSPDPAAASSPVSPMGRRSRSAGAVVRTGSQRGSSTRSAQRDNDAADLTSVDNESGKSYRNPSSDDPKDCVSPSLAQQVPVDDQDKDSVVSQPFLARVVAASPD